MEREEAVLTLEVYLEMPPRGKALVDGDVVAEGSCEGSMLGGVREVMDELWEVLDADGRACTDWRVMGLQKMVEVAADVMAGWLNGEELGMMLEEATGRGCDGVFISKGDGAQRIKAYLGGE